MAAFEVMHVTPAVRNLVREQKTHQINSIIQINKKMGMQMMDDSILELYLKGMISSEKALSYATDTAYMERKII